ANDAWAAGEYGNSPDIQTLVLHWDGSAWRRVTAPSLGGPVIGDTLTGIGASSAELAPIPVRVSPITGPPRLGAVTRRQADPSQCRTRVCMSGLLPYSPAAHASFAEVTAMAPRSLFWVAPPGF